MPAYEALSLQERMWLKFEAEEFLFREASLLDERRLEEWLALLTEDIHYWMPIRRTTTAAGSSTTFEQPMDLTATGVDDLVYSTALDGQVLRVEGTSVRNLTLTVRAVGQQVPAVVTSTLTMELLH